MRIFILADKQQKMEIQSIASGVGTSLTFESEIAAINNLENYDAFFILTNGRNIDFKNFGEKPVYVNKVIETLSESKLPENVSRINGWPGFLERPLWELVSHTQEKHDNIFGSLNRKVVLVKDTPGLVSARVISMIINEAFFAFGENISTTQEIDMAMKLGTNYPKGPFEWAEKTGIKNIFLLLQRLAENEERYLPAPALKNLYLEISERIDQ